MDKIDWFKSDFAMIIVVILFLWKNLGYNMILFMAALAAVPKNVLEAAKMDGASNKPFPKRFSARNKIPIITIITRLIRIAAADNRNFIKLWKNIFLCG